MNIGDRVWFPSVSTLVNEGTVEEIDGAFIRVKSKVPGVKWIRADEAFPTREELRASKVFGRAWAAKQERARSRSSFTTMASLW